MSYKLRPWPVTVHPDPEVSDAIKRTARWFHWRNVELDGDEIMGEAALIGLEASRAFDGRGDRAAFVAWVVRRRLCKLLLTNESWRRRMQRQQHKTLRCPVPAPAPEPSLYSVLEECSGDARYVVRKCLAENVRTASALFTTLRMLGWGVDRIAGVFDEIRESL